MARARIVNNNGQFYGIRFDCPGCALSDRGTGAHILPVDWTPPGAERSPYVREKSLWGFNGDLDRPTFSPSVLTTVPRDGFVCHSFVRDGRIEFLSDCTHELAGKTVDLPELES